MRSHVSLAAMIAAAQTAAAAPRPSTFSAATGAARGGGGGGGPFHPDLPSVTGKRRERPFSLTLLGDDAADLAAGDGHAVSAAFEGGAQDAGVFDENVGLPGFVGRAVNNKVFRAAAPSSAGRSADDDWAMPTAAVPAAMAMASPPLSRARQAAPPSASRLASSQASDAAMSGRDETAQPAGDAAFAPATAPLTPTVATAAASLPHPRHAPAHAPVMAAAAAATASPDVVYAGRRRPRSEYDGSAAALTAAAAAGASSTSVQRRRAAIRGAGTAAGAGESESDDEEIGDDAADIQEALMYAHRPKRRRREMDGGGLHDAAGGTHTPAARIGASIATVSTAAESPPSASSTGGSGTLQRMEGRGPAMGLRSPGFAGLDEATAAAAAAAAAVPTTPAGRALAGTLIRLQAAEARAEAMAAAAEAARASAASLARDCDVLKRGVRALHKARTTADARASAAEGEVARLTQDGALLQGALGVASQVLAANGLTEAYQAALAAAAEAAGINLSGTGLTGDHSGDAAPDDPDAEDDGTGGPAPGSGGGGTFDGFGPDNNYAY